jgi:REP element-mobilizing transposase RayT
MPERLKRLDIIYQRSPIYFVTACAANRRKLLANEAIHGVFKTCAKCAPSYGAWIGAYVFMPDHLHLFVALDDEQLSLSLWMKSLKSTLSSKLRELGVVSPYWQKDSSITCSGPVIPVQKNGNMYGRILFEKAWRNVGKNGRISARYSISNFTMRGFDQMCDSQRPPLQQKLLSSGLAFALCIKRIVNNELALENFMIAQPECAETASDPA